MASPPFDPTYADAISSKIIGAESGGNPLATNPNSSATGLGQFIDSTWLSLLPKYRPDLTQGKSPQEILALRTDPQISREMTAAYANENGQLLTQNGLPVTPGTTYLAHFAGPQGAVKVLSSDPNAPVSSVLGGQAVAANPFLKNMTVADLRSWADRKVGGSSPAPTPQAQAHQQPAMSPPAPSFNQPPQQSASLPAFAWSPGAQAAPGGGQMPAPQMAQSAVPGMGFMQPPPRKPPDLTQLRAFLSQAPAPIRGLLFRGQA